MAQNEPEDLDALGLIAHSYDALFSIRKRIRAVNDIPLPTRRGILTTQIGMGVLTLIAQFITYGLILMPLMRVFGITPNPWILLGWLAIPTFLVAQRVAKPMAYNKTIAEAMSSRLRRLLDDKVHRRGVPIPNRQFATADGVTHYQREWVMYPEYAAITPGEEDVTTPQIEARMAHDQSVDIQGFIDSGIQTRLDRVSAERAQRRHHEKTETFSRRSNRARVLGPQPTRED